MKTRLSENTETPAKHRKPDTHKWYWHLQSLVAQRELLELLAMRDVNARYKQSILGIYWAFLNPLATALVLTLVFSFFVKVPTGDLPYILFVLVGFLPWTFLSNSLVSATASLTGNANLLTKAQFPREILPMAAVLARGVDFLFSCAVLLLFLLYFRTPFTAALVWLPLMVLIQIILTCALALFLAAANLFFRDIGQLLNLVLLLWMYLTPVIYPASLVPEQYRQLYMLNPMVPLIESYRRVLLEGIEPHWKYLAAAALMATVLLALSYAFFKWCEPFFAETV